MTAHSRRWSRAHGTPGALDRLVRATPASRDRVVDAARALSIVVVTLWHWTLSVTHRTADGNLTMPNPIHVVPGGWLATWLLQVMPVFFLVGGYANLVGWQRTQATGVPAGRFVVDRLRRLLVPTAVWAGVWLAGELIATILPGPHRWIWDWFPGYLVPLWFLGVYGLLILTVPATATLHARHGARVLAVLAGLIAVGSVLGRGVGLAWADWVTAALVWLFCHQLGYAWRTWQLGQRPLAQRLAVAGAGLLALVVLTVFAGYPRSMVATVGEVESNIFPTNAAIAALAVFQLGLLALITPTAARLLRRPGVWKPVVALNLVAITVFLWHMTAYLIVLWVYERLGHTLPVEPTADWWAQRWLWLLAPLAVLMVLIAVFAPVETMVRRPRRTAEQDRSDDHRIGPRGGTMAEDRVRVRDLAAATPASRDRYVDFLRAFAIVMVVVGHWLAVMITFRDGRLGGEHVLAVLPWTHWLTWLFQVMGIFFLVGGYANAASWDSTRRRGNSYADWLGSRATRLLRPTTVFIAVGVPIAAAARLAGLDPEMVRLAAWVVAISLWFLAVYLVVVALTPAMLAAHRRWGLAVPAALTVVAAGFDALRLSAGVGYLGVANFLVVWLILPQLGFAWRDGTLTRTPARPWLLFLGGSAALVALTTVGPYPISMVGVPGAEVQNTSPPTVALLALAVAHTGLVLLLAGPLRRWLRRRRVWMAVIAVNGVIMTLYLWHMVPVLLVALALYPTGVMPQPEIGSASWFAWRPVWVAACGLLLGVLVAVFARFERPPGRASTATLPHARAVPAAERGATRPAVVLVLVGTAATCAGIIQLTVGGFQGAGPAGVPLAALITYLVGLVAFWAARRLARTSLPAP